jgi:hypothetical protein
VTRAAVRAGRTKCGCPPGFIPDGNGCKADGKPGATCTAGGTCDSGTCFCNSLRPFCQDSSTLVSRHCGNKDGSCTQTTSTCTLPQTCVNSGKFAACEDPAPLPGP